MKLFSKFLVWGLVAFGTVIGLSWTRNNTATKNDVVQDLNVPQIVVPVQNSLPTPFPSKRPVKTLDLTKTTRIITLNTEIDERVLEDAKKLSALSQASNDPIYVIINSPGGSVLDGGIFVGAMKASKAPVYTICTQICASMGAMIHSYGTKRLMVHNATLMFHPAAGSLQGSLEQMGVRLGYITRYVDKMGANVAQRSGLTLEQYKALVVSELWVESDDAVARHFADDIVDLNLGTQSSFDLGKVIPNENHRDSSVKTVKELIGVKN